MSAFGDGLLLRHRFGLIGYTLGTIPCKTNLTLPNLLRQNPIWNCFVPLPNKRNSCGLHKHQITSWGLPSVRVSVPKTHVVHHVGKFIHHEIVLCGHVAHHSKITTPAAPAPPLLWFIPPPPPPPYKFPAPPTPVVYRAKPPPPKIDDPPVPLL